VFSWRLDPGLWDNKTMEVGLHHLAYYLPQEIVGLEDLLRMKVLREEEVSLYRDILGVEAIHRSENETAAEIAVKVAQQALEESGIGPQAINAVIYHYTIYLSAVAKAMDPIQKIQYELGLNKAIGYSIWGEGCSSVITALRSARNMIRSGSAETVLVVGADSLTDSRRRQIPGITIQGDGGSAVILQKNCATNRIVEIASRNEGSFYNILNIGSEEEERYNWFFYMGTVRLVNKIIHRAGLSLEDISLIIPHNINSSSWARIARLLRVERTKIYEDNILSHGHAFGADIVINLADAIRQGRIRRGEYALMLSAGLGGSWGGLIIQH